MKSWSEILKAIRFIRLIISIYIFPITIIGLFVLIVWAVWSGRYVTAAVTAAVAASIYIIIIFSVNPRVHGPAKEGLAMRYPPSPVDFSVFAPQQIARGKTFVLNLWVHLREQLDAVMDLSQSLQPSEVVGFRAGVPVELGTEIVFRLILPTLDVHDEIDKVTWTGQPSNTSFRVGVPPDTTSTVHDGHFDVYTGGIRIARVLFSVALSSEKPSISKRRLQSRIERLRTAFASYSSVDRVDVLGRIQGIKKIAPDLDVFLDALSLRSGDLWERLLAEEVVSKDVFYLFWSRNAAKSTWVKREWQHALASRGIDYIDPVPLETPEIAPPPDALRALHFGDVFATFAFLQKCADRKRINS